MAKRLCEHKASTKRSTFTTRTNNTWVELVQRDAKIHCKANPTICRLESHIQRRERADVAIRCSSETQELNNNSTLPYVNLLKKLRLTYNPLATKSRLEAKGLSVAFAHWEAREARFTVQTQGTGRERGAPCAKTQRTGGRARAAVKCKGRREGRRRY